MTYKPKDALANLKAKELFNSYIEQMKLAIEEGVDVIGYLTRNNGHTFVERFIRNFDVCDS